MFRKLTVIALLSCSSLVFAGEATVAMKPVTSFGYLDTDKDARVSPNEAKVDWVVRQEFERADVDKNGFLDKEEFATLSRG
jgi:Skp family chaperone for outer membrane proteins